MEDAPKLDPAEAPAGFYAVLKSEVYEKHMQNVCNFCDWRNQCNDSKTDLLAPGNRCMGTPVIAFRDGKEYSRKDKCSVVFKKIDTGE